MQVITISNKTTTAGLLAALFAAVGLLIVRGFKTLKKAANVVRMWLRDTHNFTPGESDESEKVYMTGWQYIGFGLAVAAVCVLLSIRF